MCRLSTSALYSLSVRWTIDQRRIVRRIGTKSEQQKLISLAGHFRHVFPCGLVFEVHRHSWLFHGQNILIASIVISLAFEHNCSPRCIVINSVCIGVQHTQLQRSRLLLLSRSTFKAHQSLQDRAFPIYVPRMTLNLLLLPCSVISPTSSPNRQRDR